MHRILRLASPSFLAFSFLMFFLPWIEIQCPTSQSKLSKETPTPPRLLDDPLSGFRQPRVLFFNQSGFQMIYGGWSHPDPGPLEEPKQSSGEEAQQKLEANQSAGPWFVLYPILLLLGMFLGLKMPANKVRRVRVSWCVALALLIALVPIAIGFSLQRTWVNAALAEPRATRPDPSREAVNLT